MNDLKHHERLQRLGCVCEWRNPFGNLWARKPNPDCPLDDHALTDRMSV